MTQLGYNTGGTQAAFGAGETVISGYFAGQMAGMLLSGFRARKLGREQNEHSISLQQEMNEMRLAFVREKGQAELDFIRECHESGMAFQRECARQSYINRQQEEEFRKFCESTWLPHYRPNIEAVLTEMQNLDVDKKGVVKMKLMIARTPMVAVGMNRKGSYTAFCDYFKNEYVQKYGLNIDCLWLQTWESDCVSAMADTMNLHYIMQGIPSIVLYPIQRGSNLSLETATWGYQLGLTSMAFDKTFRVPIEEIEADTKRQYRLLMAATAYIDDCYRVLLCQSTPESLYKVKDELQKDEYVWNLVCGKYQSLIATTKDTSDILLLEDKEMDELQETIRS